jgi:hypothetical protein
MLIIFKTYEEAFHLLTGVDEGWCRYERVLILRRSLKHVARDHAPKSAAFRGASAASFHLRAAPTFISKYY